MSLLGRIGQDLVHPFGLGNAPQQPVRTPAPQAPVAQRPIIRTPGTGIVQQFTTQLPHLVSGFVNSATLGQSQHIGQLAQNAYKVEGNAINQGIQHLPQPVARPVANIANTLMVKPLLQTGQHSAQLLQNQNPYHGTNRQQIGQIGGDIVNIASALPIGKAAEGAKLLATGKMGGLGARTIQAAKTGAAGGLKYGAGFGGAQGLTSSMAQNQNLNDTLNNAFRSAIIGGASGAALGGVGGGVAPTIGAGARVAGKGIGAVTKGAKVTANKLAQVPEVIAHNQLVKTDPYYRTYSDQGQQLQTAFDRNAANGLSPNHPTQIQLGKQIAQLNTKTADMRQAMLQNAKDTAQRILPGKGVPLNQTGSAPLDSPLMPGNKLIANAAEKLQGKSLPKAPAVATAVPKKIVSSKQSIPDELKQEASQYKTADDFITAKNLEARSNFTKQNYGDRGISGKSGSGNRAAGFEAAAVKRAVSGELTPTEFSNTMKYLNSNYVGKKVAQGEVVGNSFGVVRVKTADGKVISVNPSDITAPAATKAQVLAHAKAQAVKKLNSSVGVLSKEKQAELAQAHAEATAGTASTTKPKAPLPSAAKPAPRPAGKLPGAGLGKESLGKNTPLTKDSYASTFGVSKEEAAKEIASTTKQPTKTVPKLKPAPATAAENTAKNPVKVDIPKVEAGNYEQARINPQLASHPVQYATGQLLDATKKLGLSTSDFGKMVEGTIKPSNAKEAAAVQAYRDLADRVHATSQSLGGNTAYVKNYFRHEWDLSDPEKAAQFEKYAEKLRTKSKSDNPFAFEGVDHQPRVFKTIAQGEALGFKLKNQNLADEIRHYGEGSAHALRQQALSKALTEADMNAETKPRTFELGGGKGILLSAKGMREAKGYKLNDASDNLLAKGYRKGNRGFKQMLLSVSQFHPVNISVLRAAPTLAMRGHPLRGAKGILDTFVAQADKGYSTKIQTAALRDGTVENSARIGTPIKFGSDYKTEGQIGFGKGGLGEKAIFERAMPAMHIQMVKSAVADLQKRGLSLDSKEAHALGTRINEIMGFVNTEARNLDKGTQRRLGDIFLAPQFTRSKWATNKAALTQGGLAGSYARRAVVANAAAAAVVAMGVGYALHQKSDNINDMLLRAVFHPSVPTPLKDKKGNTMELGLPATQSSEVLGLLGFSLKRGSDNHLHVDWKGGNIPGNAATYGRSRLSILPGAGLKIATNTDYAGKPLYDPNANLKTKLEQGATTLGAGLLPIGGQGIVQTNAVKKHLPGGVQQVLNANTPGSNPLIKSIGSSFGLTPKTDKTVGKGQQTTQYFDALNGASKGLNSQEKSALTMVTGSKKNPVTGAYDVAPTNDDSRAKATALLQNPKVIDKLMAMNQTLAKQGQSVDPLWTASKDQITKYYQYQAMPPGSADKTDWMNKNKGWYQPVATARNTFFNSLPPGDPNRPKAAIQYPTATPAVQTAMDEYNKLTDSTAKSTFIKAHPEVVDQWDKQATYTNALREAQGYTALKTAPKATPQLQSFMDTYNAADKAIRKGIRNSNPQAYQNMIAYYDSVDMNNINKQGAINQLQGEPDQTTKQNKAIQGLAKDIYQAPDGTYQIVPAGWMQGLSNGSGGFSKFPKKPSSGRKVSYAGLKVGGSSSKLAKGMGRGTGKVKLLTYKDPTAVKIRKPKGAILA